MGIKGYLDTINRYDDNSRHYAKIGDLNIDTNHLDAFSAAMSKSETYVLNAGCGYGRDTHALSTLDLKVIGLDLYEGLIKIAEEKYPELNFVVGNMLKLPFKDRTFNGIWSNVSLVHFETTNDVKAALSEFSRVLKSSGIV